MFSTQDGIIQTVYLICIFKHITSQMYLYYPQYLRKEEKRRTWEKEGLESLNPFNYEFRQPSSCAGNPVLTKKLPSFELATGRRAVLRCWGWQRSSHSCAPALAMDSAQLVSARMSVGTNIALTGTVNVVPCLNNWWTTVGDRNPNYSALPLLSVLYT